MLFFLLPVDKETSKSNRHLCACDITNRYGRVALKLLEGGADAEQEDREDLTALHWAARMGQERLLLLLLDHDADIEVIRDAG